MSFLRFVSLARDPQSGHRRGILQSMYELKADGGLSPAADASLEALSRWFDRHLARPARFHRKRNAGHRTPCALSWFRDSAHRHLLRMRELSALLESHGCWVEVLHCARPGYIVYEDAFQVVAEPFADTPGAAHGSRAHSPGCRHGR
jgi:hypothetical protein